MSLTNAQYDMILHQYEMKQLKSRREAERRLAYVYDTIPLYRELDEQVAAVSVAQGKKLLSGDEEAMEDLRDSLAELSGRKAQLLEDAGFAPDYLEPVYECSDCKDTGYIDGQKCHCFRQAMIMLLYEQSNIREMLRTENFDSLSYEYYEGEDLSCFKNAVRTCRNFIKNFNSDYHNLFFYGTVGTGKSFLSGCVANGHFGITTYICRTPEYCGLGCVTGRFLGEDYFPGRITCFSGTFIYFLLYQRE